MHLDPVQLNGPSVEIKYRKYRPLVLKSSSLPSSSQRHLGQCGTPEMGKPLVEPMFPGRREDIGDPPATGGKVRSSNNQNRRRTSSPLHHLHTQPQNPGLGSQRLGCEHQSSASEGQGSLVAALGNLATNSEKSPRRDAPARRKLSKAPWQPLALYTRQAKLAAGTQPCRTCVRTY